MTILIFLGSMIGAMALGVPIAFALLLCGAALMWHLNMFDAQILAQNVINGADSFPLLAVPFFMLAGEIMNAGGLSRRIVNFAMALVGHVKGGLGYVTIVAAVIMASLSGSAVADAAALTALLLPMMVAAGHDKARSAGLIASGGIIAPIIPPSIGFVIFGVAANVSISKLFMAGIFPGIWLALSLWVTWWWLVRKETIAPPPRKSLAEVLDAMRQAIRADVRTVLTPAQRERYATLTGKETVIDGYSGVGLLTAFLAENAASVIAIEVNPDAVADTAVNLQDTNNVSLYEGWLEDVLPQLPTPDLLVVHPPQKGLSKPVIHTITRKRPFRIIYISSDIATLARDGKQLSQAGYTLKAIQPIDTAPQTYHLDTVSLWHWEN